MGTEVSKEQTIGYFSTPSYTIVSFSLLARAPFAHYTCKPVLSARGSNIYSLKITVLYR